jgi:hypothetical protein
MAAESLALARTRQGYEAFATGDMTALAELLAPDVRWVVGGDSALTGTYRGREATFEFLGRLLAATDGTFVATLRTLAEPQPGLVLALVRVTAQARGIDLDEDAVQLLEVADGLVLSCRTFTEDSRRFDALIGPAVITLPGTRRATARTR